MPIVETLEPYRDVWSVVASWPRELPLCLFAGGGRYAVLAVAFSEAPLDELLALPLEPDQAARDRSDGLPFLTGYLGMLGYGDFEHPGAGLRQCSRVYLVGEALVFDQVARKVYRTREQQPTEHRYHWPLGVWPPRPGATALSATSEPGWRLIAQDSDAVYLDHVREALEEIRAGRYYQINLLRYFSLAEPPSQGAIIRRLARRGGPFAAWIRDATFEVISFSPERFVALTSSDKGLLAETWPIKGTAPRAVDPKEDRALRAALEQSGKDRAELAMIVDLMRNDLARISQPRSVEVRSPGQVESFPYVHHLVAHVVSRLARGLTFGQFWRALAPGGSITGAPKREVMLAIREKEQRERGPFMGNAFLWDRRRGRFDSSILIRTVARQGGSTYEFAAGSGIVIQSDPHREMAEIEHKCRVVSELVAPDFDR